VDFFSTELNKYFTIALQGCILNSLKVLGFLTNEIEKYETITDKDRCKRRRTTSIKRV